MANVSAEAVVEHQAQRPLYYRMLWGEAQAQDPQVLLSREWLVTNGLGGYASGTIAGVATRRYHGALVAALPAPLGRVVLLNDVAEEFRLPDASVLTLDPGLSGENLTSLPSAQLLRDFRLETGLPVWHYFIGPFEVEKRVMMPFRQNTTLVHYRVLSGPGVLRLRLRPWLHFRRHEDPVAEREDHEYSVLATSRGVAIEHPQMPPLRLHWNAPASALVINTGQRREHYYAVERARGYDFRGRLWSPGYFRADLVPGQHATLTASTEPWENMQAISPEEVLQAEAERRERLLAQAHPAAARGAPAQLVLAADQFVVRPATRAADAARLTAVGDDVRTVIAGYHWFTDWGRDTMISLEGLTLLTGRHVEAGYILRTYALHVRDGLIPNLFPERQYEGLYHTADATLWYFHAIARYVELTGDRTTLAQLQPTLRQIIEHHQRGTRFGIHVDPRDGLLVQGQAGYQLTWMDAKVGDWVVTPRRGKAVEINALWYNALRLMEQWTRAAGDAQQADAYAAAADRTARSFNERFWYPGGGYLYDVVDGEAGDDPAMRPNQIFAISLPHAVLDRAHWRPVLDQVTQRLLTPMGLRSLAPGQPDYRARYDGDLRARDAAYHQGTVWPWLVGPFVDAWLKVRPEDAKAVRDFLVGFRDHLGEACIGSVSEICDAEAPYTPRGCIAQAWSVAEALRAWVRIGGDQEG
jgi:predicted glycogen debranching enzyme